jgi:hypothetical protein
VGQNTAVSGFEEGGGTMTQEMWAASGSWKVPWAARQQENGELSPKKKEWNSTKELVVGGSCL